MSSLMPAATASSCVVQAVRFQTEGDEPPPPWPYQLLVETACQPFGATAIRSSPYQDFWPSSVMRMVSSRSKTPQAWQSAQPHRACNSRTASSEFQYSG